MRTINRSTYQRRQKRPLEKLETALRKVSGFAMFLFFMLILGKAGASDCGAAWEEIFPSTFIYTGLFAVSFFVWDYCGGNDPGNWKK